MDFPGLLESRKPAGGLRWQLGHSLNAESVTLAFSGSASCKEVLSETFEPLSKSSSEVKS